MLTFNRGDKTTKPFELAQRIEFVAAPRQHLVHISLVTDIPEDLILGSVEHSMQRQRDFNDAQIGGKMPSGARQTADYFLTNFACKFLQVFNRHLLQLGGAGDSI